MTKNGTRVHQCVERMSEILSRVEFGLHAFKSNDVFRYYSGNAGLKQKTEFFIYNNKEGLTG